MKSKINGSMKYKAISFDEIMSIVKSLTEQNVEINHNIKFVNKCSTCIINNKSQDNLSEVTFIINKTDDGVVLNMNAASDSSRFVKKALNTWNMYFTSEEQLLDHIEYHDRIFRNIFF